jgi:hypothetical protein
MLPAERSLSANLTQAYTACFLFSSMYLPIVKIGRRYVPSQYTFKFNPVKLTHGTSEICTILSG